MKNHQLGFPPGYSTGDRWARPVGRVYMHENNDRSFDNGESLGVGQHGKRRCVFSNFDGGGLGTSDEVRLF